MGAGATAEQRALINFGSSFPHYPLRGGTAPPYKVLYGKIAKAFETKCKKNWAEAENVRVVDLKIVVTDVKLDDGAKKNPFIKHDAVDHLLKVAPNSLWESKNYSLRRGH